MIVGFASHRSTGGYTTKLAKVSEIWKLMVFSNGRTGDLRSVFPYLSMVAVRYAGENTGKELKVTFEMGGKEYKAFVSK